MFEYDLLTNLIFLAVDVLFCVSLVRISSRQSPPAAFSTYFIFLAGLFLGLSVIGFILSNAFYVVSGLRSFAMMRSFGHFLFWHLPICLIVSAFARPRIKSLALFSLGGAAFLFSTYIFAYHIEPYRLEVTEYEFTHPSLSGLERPIVIAQVADIQTDRVGSYERRVLETLADLSPDLILYCGDFVQIEGPREERAVSTELHALIQELVPEPPLGSYAIYGDVDAPHLWEHLLRDANIRVMVDESLTLQLPGVAIDLVGLDVETSHTGHLPALQKAFSTTDPERLKLILAHGPDFVTSLDESHAPFLALAGHTHGGQVRFPFIGPLITFSALPNRLADAFEPFGPGFLSVSRGIGMERIEAPRLRFLCRPELRLITLKPPESPPV